MHDKSSIDNRQSSMASTSVNKTDVLKDVQLAFIGCGVMAEAIIAGLLDNNLVGPERIVGSHPRQERREELQTKYGVRVVETNEEAVVASRSGSAKTSSIVVRTGKP